MTSPKALLLTHDLRAKKRLGQSFLSDSAMADQIVMKSDVLPEDTIVEIGAGLGALTIPLARHAGKVYAIEIDRQLIDILNLELAVSGISNVDIITDSIFKIDLNHFSEKHGVKFVVMGNLPYHVSSQVVVKMIQERQAVTRAIFMFQKELAMRLLAAPGSKAYGRLAVMLNYCADVRALMNLDASRFFPKPKVDSQVLEIRFKSSMPYPADDEAFLFKVIKAGFGKRRKTLKNALCGSEFRINSSGANQALNEAGIDPMRRAETLTVKEFVDLSHCLAKILIPGADDQCSS